MINDLGCEETLTMRMTEITIIDGEDEGCEEELKIRMSR